MATGRLSCQGICSGFENNGVCEVKIGLCPNGTDCYDCNDALPIWPIAGLVISPFFLALSAYALYLQRRRRRSTKQEATVNAVAR